MSSQTSDSSNCWPVCLSIAGFDGSGGAGLQADTKTFSALGCYAANVLTALPVQNTQGVRNCYRLPNRAITEQLQAIFDDFRPDAIKIGMLFDTDIIELVCDFLSTHADGIPIVTDPVMMAKSGDALLKPEAISALSTHLLPLTTVLTPNLPEAQTLANSSSEDLSILAQTIETLGTQYVLVKGGHSDNSHSTNAVDVLFGQGQTARFSEPRIESNNTHGTGCTLSAAITAYLAQGHDIPTAVLHAKTYLTQAIAASAKQSIGQGHGAVHHFHAHWAASTQRQKL